MSSVAATSGRNLYMKMKKPSEKTTLTAASQPLIAAAFSPLRLSGRRGRLCFASLRRGNRRHVFILASHHVFDGDVGRKTQGAEAKRHGVAQRHDAANDGPGHPLVFFRGTLQRLAHGHHFARRACGRRLPRRAANASSRLRARLARRPGFPRHFPAQAEAARPPENARNFLQNAQSLDAPGPEKRQPLGYHRPSVLPGTALKGLDLSRESQRSARQSASLSSILRSILNSMRTLAETCEAIAATTKKLQKTAIVADYLKSRTADEAAVSAVFLSGRAFPAWEETTLQVGGSLLWRAVAELSGKDEAALTASLSKTWRLGFGGWGGSCAAIRTGPERSPSCRQFPPDRCGARAGCEDCVGPRSPGAGDAARS